MHFLTTLLVYFSMTQHPVEGRYERYMQVCSVVSLQDYYWVLDLRSNNVYHFTTTTSGSAFDSKPTSTFESGFWKMNGDTITLYQLGKEAQGRAYIRNHNKLYRMPTKYPTAIQLPDLLENLTYEGDNPKNKDERL